MAFESLKEGNLNISPQDIFDIDSQDFENYKTLGDYLSQTIKTKADLITALHFSDLSKKFSHLFFELGKINTTDLTDGGKKTKDTLNKITQRIEFEKEEGGELLKAHKEKRENIRIKFDNYKFSYSGDRGILSEEKEIPMTKETQIEYLDKLIDKGYFDMDNYNSRQKHIDSLLHSMASTALQGNNIIYCKYIIIEAFKKNKLNDTCLYTLIEIMLYNSKYSEDFLLFLNNIYEYPNLINRIIRSMNIIFLKNQTTKIIGINKHYPEDTKGINHNNTLEMIEKGLL